MTESQLAWELADRIGARLSHEERTAVFVDLGCGDFLSAIHRILHIVAQSQHRLPAMSLERLHIWSRTYGREPEYAPLLARIKKAPPR
ncbi:MULTISPECIES: tryptophanase [Mycobacteriaceae]|uniref:tryptophanase n=1 Tax=Mycobacteriaceae TaxID=1762 RepID=UPI0010575ED0|nr:MULTISPECIES: tryptophanase [Mycobacteriaceae]WNG88054.1 tryptophanase [Mycobacterium sp. ITM-2016-00317]